MASPPIALLRPQAKSVPPIHTVGNNEVVPPLPTEAVGSSSTAVAQGTKFALEIQEKLTKLYPPSVASPFKSSTDNYVSYACSVSGWKCTLKTGIALNTNSAADPLKAEKAQQKLRKEIAILEQLPWHPNIIKYLFHDKLPNGTLRLFTQWHDTSLSYCLHHRRIALMDVEQKLQQLQGFLNESAAENDLLSNAIDCESSKQTIQMIQSRWRGVVESALREAAYEASKKARLEWGWIEHQGPKLLLDLVRGLELMHRHRIIHRDLCPDNIFVSRDGDDSTQITIPSQPPPSLARAKVASVQSFASGEIFCVEKYKLFVGNFFLAKRITKNSHASTVVGSVRYRAPEVLWAPTYDHKADIWSLGMIAYTLATGLVPFEDVNEISLPTKLASGDKPEVPDDLLYKPSLRALLDVFQECTQTKPEDRPTILEIKEALTLSTLISDIKNQRKNSVPTSSGDTTPRSGAEDADTLPIFDASTTASHSLKQFFKSRYGSMKENEREKEKKRLSIFHRLKKTDKEGKEKDKDKEKERDKEREKEQKNSKSSSSTLALPITENLTEMKFLLFFSNDIHLPDFYFFQCVKGSVYKSIEELPFINVFISKKLIGRLEGPCLDKFVKESEESQTQLKDPLSPNDEYYSSLFKALRGCGHSISTYPYNPLANCRLGDPICDRFELVRFQSSAIAAVADGCNWGMKPRIAAERACKAAVGYLEENIKNITNIEEAALYLLRSIALAHNKIVAGQRADDDVSGTTTLLVSVVLPVASTSCSGTTSPLISPAASPPASPPIARKEGDKEGHTAPVNGEAHPQPVNYVLLWGSVGDCKLYLYTQNGTPSFMDLTLKSSFEKKTAQNESPPSHSPSSHSPPSLANLQSISLPTMTTISAISEKAASDWLQAKRDGVFRKQASVPTVPTVNNKPISNKPRGPKRITDPGGRLGFYSPDMTPVPDLGNLYIDYCMVNEDDIVVLLSDGVHDNLDPEVLGEPVSKWGLNSWEAPTASVTEARSTFTSSIALKLIEEEAREQHTDPNTLHVEPPHITRALLNHCLSATAEGRAHMEQQGRKATNRAFHGKCDHATCLAFSVRKK